MDREEPTSAEEMLFNANLQEFANRVGIICGLEANERIAQEEAYRRIRDLWKQLKKSRKNLRIGGRPEEGET